MKLKKINVLFECNSCRDYAFAKSFSKSRLLNQLYLLGNNTMAKEYGSCIELTPQNLLNFAKDKKIDLFISFNESHSLAGIINYYKYNLKIPTVGVTKYWFNLEASKIDAKKFMIKNNINTPKYIELHRVDELYKAVDLFGFPLVLKFNGLFGGFGVYIASDLKEAEEIINKLSLIAEKEHFTFQPDCEFDNDIHVVAEEFIQGEECSLLSLWDGNTLLSFEPIKDYKRAFDDDKGQNTGGMGGFIPYNLSNSQRKMLDNYIEKLKYSFKKHKPDFAGFIYSGLIFTKEKLYVLEYNMRPGDPEGQILSSHLKNDFLSLLYRASIGKLNEKSIIYKKGITGCVSLVNSTYLKKHYNFEEETSSKVESLIDVSNIDCKFELFFDSSMSYKPNNIIQSDSPMRLVNICTTSNTPFAEIYNELSNINLKNIYYRTDFKE